MANVKITDLTALSADVVTADELEISDTSASASAKSKRVTASELVNATLVDAVASLPLNYLAGLNLSNGSDADHDINIAVGEARNSADDTNLKLTSAFVKQIDVTWAAGSAAGGLSSSLTAPANTTWYHVHLILVSGAVDVGFDTSITAANLITDHGATKFRRIGSVLTDGSANIVAFTQLADVFLWTVPVLEFSTDNPGTSAVTPAISSPLGVQLEALITFALDDPTPTGPTHVLITAIDQTDSTPSSSMFTLRALAGSVTEDQEAEVHMPIRTDTTSKFRYRVDDSEADVKVHCITTGWIDTRGRT